jgi:hypothetical protein
MLTHHSNEFAGKILDDLIDVRLFREENQSWVEKVVITRVWVSTASATDNVIEQLRETFDMVLSNAQASLSAPATHAAQTVRDAKFVSLSLVADYRFSYCGSESNHPPVKHNTTWLKHGVGSACIQYLTKLEHKTKLESRGQFSLISKGLV